MNKRRRFKAKRRRRLWRQLALYHYYRALTEELIRLRPMAPWRLEPDS